MSKRKENNKQIKGDWTASISRLFVLTKKNLLRFWKNPKALGFLIGIPIMYYLIVGLIFAGADEGLSNYNIGWVDDDSTSAVTHPQYDLDLIYEIFDDMDEIEMTKYDSKDEAIEAALNEEIDAFIYFPQGFEADLEDNSYIDIAFWNNDTSTSTKFNISSMLDNLVSQTSSFFKITNETETDLNILLNNFENSEYDGILILNNNFSKGLDNDWDVNMSYQYRTDLSYAKSGYIIGVIEGIINSYFNAPSYNSTVSIPIFYPVPGSTLPDPVEYEMFFLQSVSPTTKSIIQNLVGSVISGIINTNPLEIDISYEVKSTVGEEVNYMTYQAPGLILYGPMTILSFAVIVLTSEKKDGIYKRLSSSEVKNWELVSSSILANLMLVFMQFAIGATILFMFGWNPIIYSPLDAIIGVMIAMFLFSFFILALAFALTPIFKDPDTAGGGVWVILIPLMMMSGIFFPIEMFGESMQAVANVLPTRFAVLILQGLLLKGLPLTDPSILLNFGLLTLYSIVIFAIGIKAFNKFKR